MVLTCFDISFSRYLKSRNPSYPTHCPKRAQLAQYKMLQIGIISANRHSPSAFQSYSIPPLPSPSPVIPSLTVSKTPLVFSLIPDHNVYVIVHVDVGGVKHLTTQKPTTQAPHSNTTTSPQQQTSRRPSLLRVAHHCCETRLRRILGRVVSRLVASRQTPSSKTDVVGMLLLGC